MTGETFHIGERALLLPCGLRQLRSLRCAIYFGTQVKVVSELRAHRCCEGGFAYTVETVDGSRLWVAPKVLQKLPPSDPAYLKFRDQLVREAKAEPPVLEPRHPSIVAMLEFIGQGGGR